MSCHERPVATVVGAASVTVAIAGNPNTGKTAIFNALTGVRQKTGNWPGVTVERKEGRYSYERQRISVVDLPGTYSLDATSPLMNPFMSCGARLPVYALFAAAFFPRSGQSIVFLLYLIGIAVAVATGLIMKHSLLRGQSEAS